MSYPYTSGDFKLGHGSVLLFCTAVCRQPISFCVISFSDRPIAGSVFVMQAHETRGGQVPFPTNPQWPYPLSPFSTTHRGPFLHQACKAKSIVRDRINYNLDAIRSSTLVTIPEHRVLSLEQFVALQERCVKQQAVFINIKSKEVCHICPVLFFGRSRPVFEMSCVCPCVLSFPSFPYLHAISSLISATERGNRHGFVSALACFLCGCGREGWFCPDGGK